MKQLEPMIRKNAMTVSGKTVGENLRDYKVADEETIRPLSRPLSDKAGIVLVRGNLAPIGGVVKIGPAPRQDLEVHRQGALLHHRRRRHGGDQVEDHRARAMSSCCAGSACAAAPAWAWPRAWCSRSMARASAPMSRSSPTASCPGLVNKGLVVGEINAGGRDRRAARRWSPTATPSPSTPKRGTIHLDVPDAELATRRAKLKLAGPAFGGRLARDLRALGAAAVERRGAGASEIRNAEGF